MRHWGGQQGVRVLLQAGKQHKVIVSKDTFGKTKETTKETTTFFPGLLSHCRIQIKYDKVICESCKGCWGAPTMVGFDLPKFETFTSLNPQGFPNSVKVWANSTPVREKRNFAEGNFSIGWSKSEEE